MAVAIATSGFVSQANAQNFPTARHNRRSVSAGSGTDTGARLLAQHLKDSLGQSVVIDNKPVQAAP
jgi:tripartite-type tricarboxylate transporter receptor subunit TctC